MAVDTKRGAQPSRLPDPPAEYDGAYMRLLIARLEAFMRAQTAPGRVAGTTANFNKLPTSATGLASGELWNDGGDVKIVP